MEFARFSQAKCQGICRGLPSLSSSKIWQPRQIPKRGMFFPQWNVEYRQCRLPQALRSIACGAAPTPGKDNSVRTSQGLGRIRNQTGNAKTFQGTGNACLVAGFINPLLPAFLSLILKNFWLIHWEDILIPLLPPLYRKAASSQFECVAQLLHTKVELLKIISAPAAIRQKRGCHVLPVIWLLGLSGSGKTITWINFYVCILKVRALT